MRQLEMTIRKEEEKDYDEVFALIKNAFEDEVYTDHKEQFLVARLRNSSSFIQDLSLVAEIDGQLVGYVLLTKIFIVHENAPKTTSLALAPVAVLKKYQGKGIGAKLIQAAHEKASELKFASIILLGHEKYYPRFGYRLAKDYNIKLPFEAPDENCMVLELVEGALKNAPGTVEYPKEFYE